jgi:hypothetical protein
MTGIDVNLSIFFFEVMGGALPDHIRRRRKQVLTIVVIT